MLFYWRKIAIQQATGIGGVGGIFGIPPLAENFSKIPPLEILGQAAILFFKWEKR